MNSARLWPYVPYLQSPTENGSATLALGEQALALLSPENGAFRAIAAIAKAIAYYTSSANDAMASIEYGHQAVSAHLGG